MAAGCRIPCCSTGSSPRSSSVKPKPSAPKAGNGSRSRTDFPYGHTYGLRHIAGEPVALTDEEVATADALQAEYERLEQAMRMPTNCPTRSIERLGEIETALAALDDRPVKFDPERDRARRRVRQHRWRGRVARRTRLCAARGRAGRSPIRAASTQAGAGWRRADCEAIGRRRRRRTPDEDEASSRSPIA